MLSTIALCLASSLSLNPALPPLNGWSVPSSTSRAHEAPSRRDIICGQILANQRFKARIAERPFEVRRAMHANRNLAFGDADGEWVALHVRERLDEAEITALAIDGVRVARGLWVPPVPGAHEHGFHLARLEYASIDRVRGDGRFVRITSAATTVDPLHEIALEVIGAAAVHAGEPLGPFLGTGVLVAVADSGVDLSHPDLPVPIVAYDVTTGDWVDEWSEDVANTVIWHGTHVTGTVLGRGTLSDGTYRGAAPDADLAAYKLGNDTTGQSSAADMIKCVTHAASIGADIYTVSYGGFTTYMDGSSAMSQAFDAAFAAGTLCFASAGNSAQNGRHRSLTIAPGEEATFTMSIAAGTAAPYDLPIDIRAIWRDGNPDDLDLIAIECLSLGDDGSFELDFIGTSPRNTRLRSHVLWPNVPPGAFRTYVFRATHAPEGVAPIVLHLYQTSTSSSTFGGSDPHFTVVSPALTDTVLAIGAWVHRTEWVDWLGMPRSTSQTLDTLAGFSSRGPRVDGALKPDIVAPGSMTISLRDGQFANTNSRIISNDGVNDGSGPANYYIANGTSMSAPLAAGAAALLREAFPRMTAGQLRHRLVSTATVALEPTTLVGRGMIDLIAALTPAAADLNGDGVVDGLDLGVLLASWGPCAGCAADINGDGTVDSFDLAVLLAAWGE